MLFNVPPSITPELLRVLAEAGHGDEILISDTNFPSNSQGVERVVRCDGVPESTSLLRDILQLFPIDQYVAMPVAVMKVVGSDVDPPIFKDFQAIVDEAGEKSGLRGRIAMERVERFAFYERAKKCFAIIASGETRLYGNIIIKKGVIGPGKADSRSTGSATTTRRARDEDEEEEEDEEEKKKSNGNAKVKRTKLLSTSSSSR